MVEAAGCHNFRLCRQKTPRKAATSYFITLDTAPLQDTAQKPQRFAPIKHKASITAHGADPILGPTGTYMALCLIYANRHGAELLSFCFQQNRHLTWELTHCFCGRGPFLKECRLRCLL
mgnify:CR=1 FL=1